MSLSTEVVEAGFVKEEVNNAGVSVEEIPADYVAKHLPDFTSSRQFNMEAASADEYLSTCFEAPFDSVNFTLLSHNHIMLVLRAWMTGAKWNIPFDEKRQITYCDDLSLIHI